ncbi:MAG: HAMP domain-containing histidine kinase [Bacteroidetes bacterium]|nr:MAG: HAMP domain-containing histidine kinase [Bacteroidota bacterium]
MVFSRFNTGLILRIIVLNMVAIAAGFLLFENRYTYTPAVLLGIETLLVVELVVYLRRTQRKVTRFFESALYHDFNFTFTKNDTNPDTQELHAALNSVADRFRQRKMQAEDSIKFNETVIDQIPLGILIFNADNTLYRYNNHARKILGDNTTAHVNKLLEKYNFLPDLPGYAASPAPTIVEVAKENGSLTLAVQEQRFVHDKKTFKLLTLQNFSDPLDRKEQESWQNIIRVLTHEIMNSLTPVVSLTETALQLTKQENQTEILQQSLEIAHKRGQGLLGFVHSYRKITNIKPLQKTVFRVGELISSIAILKSEELRAKNIQLTTAIIPEDLEMEGDYELLEQVVINLVNNAADAIIDTANARIEITAGFDYLNKIQISVSDNGPGVPKDILDKIFIPFFTTKKQGTGIGLSLSKQIALMHGGSLYFEKAEAGNTRIVLKV